MSTQTGRIAEALAAEFLQGKGLQVLAQNWRTRWCEIDIVAKKGDTIYFTEVKYRRSNAWGSGLDYITPAKLRQMHFAARFWMAQHSAAHEYRLSAIEMTGQPPHVTEWLESID